MTHFARLVLQNFRSYKERVLSFDPGLTYIVGHNTAGKSNILEAIYLLSSGKSFRAETDNELIHFQQMITRAGGKVEREGEGEKLEVLLHRETEESAVKKKYLLNGVSRRRVDFAGVLPAMLFVPSDLDIVTGSPGKRRQFLDSVLESVDRDYRIAAIGYEKALRQRNALLRLAKETGSKDAKRFVYWDELIIMHGQVLTEKRETFVNWMNEQENDLITFQVVYDKSVISEARLQQYDSAEIGSGVTLVGPHRDDFFVEFPDKHAVKTYGSRGQQRLVVLALKLYQMAYIEKMRGERPILLLDDIFSELDDHHIEVVMNIVGKQQTIITTTHKEFVETSKKQGAVIELESNQGNTTHEFF